MTWYYVNDGKAAGPISDEELLSQLRLGSILPTTLVWRSGMANWRAASEAAAQIQVSPPRVEPTFASPFAAIIDAPPELTSGTPPVMSHFFCTYCGTIIPADQLVRISGRNVCAACKLTFVQQVREGLDVPVKAPVLGAPATFAVVPENDLADPALRLVGYILDLLFIGVVIGTVFFILMMVLGVATYKSRGSPSGGEPIIGLIFIALIGLAFAGTFFYWAFFIGKGGATPGMKIMKVKMVRADRSRVTYRRALGRAVLLYVINMFTMGLTNITAFFDAEKRTVVDMICDTRVVRN